MLSGNVNTDRTHTGIYFPGGIGYQGGPADNYVIKGGDDTAGTNMCEIPGLPGWDESFKGGVMGFDALTVNVGDKGPVLGEH